MYFRIDLLELIFPTSCRHICGGPGRWFHRREVALHSAGEAVKRQPNSHGGNAMRHTEPVQAPNAPSTAHPQHVEDHDRANAPDPQRKSWSILALDLVAQVLVVLDIMRAPRAIEARRHR